MFGKNKQQIVISSSDVEAALQHYKSMPLTVTNGTPSGWGRMQIISWIREYLPDTVNIGDTFEVGTGIWAHIMPLGYEFMNYQNTEHCLQVILSFRSVCTDLDSLITLD